MSRIDHCRRTSGISLAAMAVSLLIAPQNAQSQSFNGTPTVEFGDVTFDVSPIPSITNVNVNSQSAVINWNVGDPPNSGPIIFQPANTTANFISSPANNFIVLNRILPTNLSRAVQFNGTVNAPGNSVFFYSPGGIVLGSTAVFNVGRLLLTTNNVAVDGNGGFFQNNDLSVASLSSGSIAAVNINSGAQINALSEGSFVVAIAPQIIDSGTTVVNGTKALVAGEFVNMTYNSGLFDISVTQGTAASGEVIRHDGSTTGPASSGAGDFHRIYMVAIPSNTAVSMFISGANGLGFNVAGAADVVGNAIVLSGGSNITEASSGTGDVSPFAATPVTATAADIQITEGNYTSGVNAQSNNAVNINIDAPGITSFAGSLLAQATRQANMNITSGNVTVAGELLLSADAVAPTNDSSDQQAGAASLTVGTGTSLTTNNNATISAQGFGGASFSIGDGGDGRGGVASVTINGNSIWNANAGLRLQAEGYGGTGATGGNGTGGTANVSATNGSILNVLGGFEVNADGNGSDGEQLGGNGTGGIASVNVGSGSIINVSQADGFFVNARGQGGAGVNDFQGNGGNGTGGIAIIGASNSSTLTTAVQINQIDASGNAGISRGTSGPINSGGSGMGGTASIRLENSSIVRLTGTNSNTFLNAAATGGDDANGGAATGGNLNISNSSDSVLEVESAAFNAQAQAIGGNGLNGGAATGGNILADLQGTSTFLGTATFDASGTGGDGANVGGSVPNGVGGDGTGGTALVRSAGTTSFSAPTSGLQILANSTGGDGFVGGNGVGSATGQASLTINAGTVALPGGINVSASGTGGNASGFGTSAVGGNGTGSNAVITTNGGVITIASNFSTNAFGLGGSGNIGGNGRGGTARLNLNNGQVNVQSSVGTIASGRGGQGNLQGGNAFGGEASVRTSGAGGSLNISNADLFVLSASATGGDAFSSISAASGGNATAGTTELSASNGSTITVTVSSINVDSRAEGGFGQAGAGGNALAGTAQIRALSGGSVLLSGNAQTSLSANAIGGRGTTSGGTAIGGTATGITEIASNFTVSSALSVDGSAEGGASNSGDGGAAAGGTILLNTQGTMGIAGGLRLNGNGAGGTSANGGNGGTGTGGLTRLLSGGTTTVGLVLDATSNGTGGNGRNGGTGTGGQTGGTQVVVSGGTFTASDAVLVDSSSLGGNAIGFGNGGAALGGSGLFAVTGGNAVLSSVLNVNGLATGGAGRNGGNGTGGTATVLISNGSLNLTGSSTLSTDGSGGDASVGLGGTGGDGRGGTSGFSANNPSANVTITANGVVSLSRGYGGIGGNASMAMLPLGLPLRGGNGGNGTGGTSLVGSANSAGNLNLGVINAVAGANGGVGGDGGTFGPGGNGGNATGGEARVGFNAASATATGTLTASGVAANTVGAGGAGAAGTAIGNGGNAFGGNSFFGNEAGGVITNNGQATINANGIGGAGAIAGMGEGGNAILATSPNPNAVGDSSLSTEFAVVLASGIQRVTTGPVITNQTTGRYGRAAIVANGGTIRSSGTSVFALGTAGQSTVPIAFGIVNSGLLARNADLEIFGSFNGQFSGDAALSADGGNINFTGTISPVTTGLNFTTPGNIVNTLTGAVPAGTGQVTSSTFMNIAAGGNILTPNNTYVAQRQAIITAGGNLLAGGVTAGGPIFLQSGGIMSVGNITGQDELEAISGAAMTLGNIRADSDVDLTAVGAVATGTISSGDTVTIGSGATISTGNIDAGINNPSADPAAAYAVGLRGVGNVTTGSITAANRIGIVSETGAINTGAIGTGEFFLALAETGVTVNGGITTGTGANGITYIADASMLALINPATLNPAPVFAAAPVRLNGNVAIAGPVTTGRFVSASTGTFNAGGAISAANADTAAGPALFITSGGNVTAQNLTTSAGTVSVNGDASITAGNINAAAGVSLLGTGIINSGNVTSGGAVGYRTQGAINAGNIQAAADLNLFSNAAVTAGTVNGSGGFNVNSTGNIATGAITVNNQVSLISRAGAISTGAVNTGQYFLALADTGVTVNGGITTGTGANGVTYIANSIMTDLIDPVTQDPTSLFNAAPSRVNGNVAITGPVTTGRFVSGGSGSFASGGAINAVTSALISAGGLATFTGIVSAPIIDLTSGGVDIGANGGLGTATTATLNINAEPGVAAIRLGGDAGTGYVIDSNEMARLRAQNIRFRAGGTAAPLLTIGNFTLLGSAGASPNLVGGSGAFSIETNGAVRVIGNAAIGGAAAGNALSITAGGRIDIVNDLGGSIRLSNAAGEPAGILNLSAGTVTSATDSFITQLTQDANFVGRDAALDATAAAPLEQGYLGAGTMNVSVSNGLFIQNSNTTQLRGGYTVGAGGLNVTANNSAGPPVNLVVNGRALQANGTFLTNKDALDAATFTSLSQFAPGATLNGCLITGAPCVIFSDGVLQFVSTQQANAIENADEDGDLVASGEAQPIVYVDSLVPDPAAAAQPRITEPVTGSGNSEAWSQTPNATGEQP